ncbi:hypothetical protein JMN32_00725 [Fulvivirga sp. 29W222]|uniref:Uncharacterized protein n=1 Tax=Fulvivirga marina TaxID=2494733 RepID=A0A937KAP1_9BACT|nr:hypothetical protein [Fulvivirga marina]MBL6444812.1 hypothetical protein [Fulvivirga marina]
MEQAKYIFLSLLFCSCIYADDEALESLGEMEVYTPIYAGEEDNIISFQDSYPLKKPGKIYVYGSYLFVNEQQIGIHIINNENPAELEYVVFFRLPGNVDMAVRGNYLYADHVGDLVAINISDLRKPVVSTRIEGIYSYAVMMPPEPGYFECIDRARKHLMIGWEKKIVENPECYW